MTRASPRCSSPAAPRDGRATSSRPSSPSSEAGEADRWLLRSVQRYVLNIRQRQLDELLRTGAVKALACGLYLLEDDIRYDRRFGLLPRDNPLDALTMVQ